MHSTLIESNEAQASGYVAHGGAFYVRQGQLELAEQTAMRHNSLFDHTGAHNHSGASMHVGSALVVYVLPTPAAHWISAIECVEVYNACPDACEQCTYPGEDYTDPNCILTLYANQPCPWQTIPALRGQWAQVILPGALDHPHFPVPCSSGFYGTPGDVLTQADSVCGGRCPAGHICPDAATTTPLPCPSGHYCPEGSTLPLPCPSGTSFAGTGASSESTCELVPPGYYSAAGRAQPSSCGAAAFFCPGNGSLMPNVVQTGYISLPADTEPDTRTSEAPCPDGYVGFPASTSPQPLLHPQPKTYAPHHLSGIGARAGSPSRARLGTTQTSPCPYICVQCRPPASPARCT